jgi:hypothetical protein
MFPHIRVVTPSQRQNILEDERIPRTCTTSIAETLSLPFPLRNCVELNKVVDDLFFGCINSSTKSAYISGFKCVIRFLQSYSGSFGEYKYSNISGDNIRTVISAFTEDVLIYIIAYCQSFLGLKCSTIKLYLAGVRHFGITYANRNPLVDQYGNQLLRIHNVLKSVKNSDPKPARKKLPITYVLLAKMFNCLKNGIFNSVTDLVLQTACVVAFFGFLRCGEFTCKTNVDSNIHLCIGDIDFVSHDCVKLFLKTSKTDVYRQGVYIKLLKTDNDLCSYKLLRKLIMNRKSSNATEKDPLFVEEHNIALSRNYFMSKLKTLLFALRFRG